MGTPDEPFDGALMTALARRLAASRTRHRYRAWMNKKCMLCSALGWRRCLARQNETCFKGETMKDVKVDVRVNVGVDAASVILLLASATMALFFYKQNKQDKLKAGAS